LGSRNVAEATIHEKLINKRGTKSHEPIRNAGFDATNPRSSAFICGSFSSDPIAINRIFFQSHHCIFFRKHKSSFFRSLAEDYRY
jgi:hypothetical protein